MTTAAAFTTAAAAAPTRLLLHCCSKTNAHCTYVLCAFFHTQSSGYGHFVNRPSRDGAYSLGTFQNPFAGRMLLSVGGTLHSAPTMHVLQLHLYLSGSASSRYSVPVAHLAVVSQSGAAHDVLLLLAILPSGHDRHSVVPVDGESWGKVGKGGERWGKVEKR